MFQLQTLIVVLSCFIPSLFYSYVKDNALTISRASEVPSTNLRMNRNVFVVRVVFLADWMKSQLARRDVSSRRLVSLNHIQGTDMATPMATPIAPWRVLNLSFWLADTSTQKNLYTKSRNLPVPGTTNTSIPSERVRRLSFALIITLATYNKTTPNLAINCVFGSYYEW